MMYSSGSGAGMFVLLVEPRVVFGTYFVFGFSSIAGCLRDSGCFRESGTFGISYYRCSWTGTGSGSARVGFFGAGAFDFRVG